MSACLMRSTDAFAFAGEEEGVVKAGGGKSGKSVGDRGKEVGGGES